MILSDRTLRKMIDSGELGVSPITDSSIQPASIDCRLGDNFLVVEDRMMQTIDLSSEIIYREIKGPSITIPPHSFLLATTMECVRLPRDLTAFVEGRSSIGRIGLFIQNAGWVDPGFEGQNYPRTLQRQFFADPPRGGPAHLSVGLLQHGSRGRGGLPGQVPGTAQYHREPGLPGQRSLEVGRRNPPY